MFFGEDRIAAMREMILADRRGGPQEGARQARAVPEGGLRRHLRGDGRPARSPSACSTRRCTSSCRTTPRGRRKSPSSLGISPAKVKERVEELHEFNPMMGFRGCRLPIVFPEIGDMQVRAIIEAAIEVQEEGQERAARDHDPAGRRRRGTDDPQEAGDRGGRGVHEEGRREGRVPDRHDDRAAARRPDRRQDRRGGRVLLASAPTT